MALVDTFDLEHAGGDMPLRKENGHTIEHLREIPRPVESLDGKIYDARGETVQPATPTLMARLNEKSKDEFTITKGMAAILAICLTAIGIFLGYVVPTIREGGRESEKVLTIERDVKDARQEMKSLGEKFDKLNDRIIEQQRFIDRTQAAQGGFAAAQGGSGATEKK